MALCRCQLCVQLWAARHLPEVHFPIGEEGLGPLQPRARGAEGVLVSSPPCRSLPLPPFTVSPRTPEDACGEEDEETQRESYWIAPRVTDVSLSRLHVRVALHVCAIVLRASQTRLFYPPYKWVCQFSQRSMNIGRKHVRLTTIALGETVLSACSVFHGPKSQALLVVVVVHGSAMREVVQLINLYIKDVASVTFQRSGCACLKHDESLEQVLLFGRCLALVAHDSQTLGA